jgi:hypothetical protein
MSQKMSFIYYRVLYLSIKFIAQFKQFIRMNTIDNYIIALRIVFSRAGLVAQASLLPAI